MTGFLVDVLGLPFGVAADLLRHDLTVRSGFAIAAVVAVVAGHLDRKIERARFGATLRLHGFRDHGEYVDSPLWKARRRAWLAALTRRACRVCGRAWQDGPSFHAHHVDYARAGAGHELDRDLIPICSPCHTLVHAFDRRLRTAGVSLRRCTGLVIVLAYPLRPLLSRRELYVHPRPNRSRRRPPRHSSSPRVRAAGRRAGGTRSRPRVRG